MHFMPKSHIVYIYNITWIVCYYWKDLMFYADMWESVYQSHSLLYNVVSCLRLKFQTNISIIWDILAKFIVLFDMSVNNIYTI